MAKLQFSLDGEPDPWFEHAKAQVDLRQFSAITPSLPLTSGLPVTA